MIKTAKKIIGGFAEVQQLQARSQGMGFIESRLAQQLNSAALAKVITGAFGISGVSKEDKKAARETLKKKYGVDPDVEAGFGTGFGLGGGGGGTSSKRVIRKIEELKKLIVGMAESMTAITKKTDAIGEQNNQILQSLQGRVREQVGQIMGAAPVTSGGNDLPYETEQSEGGIITEKETLKEVVREAVVEKPVSAEEPKSESSSQSPQETPGDDGKSAPTAVPKSVSEKSTSIFQKGMDIVRKKYPILGAIMPTAGGESNDTPTASAPSALSEVKGDIGSLQPALQGIAEKKPVSSQIEPDELQMLLKDALKDAFEEIKNENPDLFKSEGDGGGGLLGSLAGSLLGRAAGGIAGKTAAKTAAKTGGKAVGKAVLKSALKKIPIVGAIAGLGFAASRAMSGDWTGAAMEAGSGLAGTVPGIGTAASVGIDAALAARDAGVMGGAVPPKPEPELSTAVPTSSGAEIIEMNRRIQSGEVSVRSTPNGTPIVQRIVNNNMMPKSEKKDNIEVGNKESTFNRLLAQDFDHPSTYSNFNMG